MLFHDSLKVLAKGALLGLVLVAQGCATFGLVYEDVGHPPIDVIPQGRSVGMAWDPNLNASTGGRELTKRGVACSQDILKLVAWGDGTQAAAAKEAGITEVVGLDFENTAILGFVYTRNCTVVYGNADKAPAAAAGPVTETPAPEPMPLPAPEASAASEPVAPPPAPVPSAPAPAPTN